MREDELLPQKTLEEKLDISYKKDSIKRQKYWCNKCKSNHYLDSEIGKAHQRFGRSLGKGKNEEKTKKDKEPKKIHPLDEISLWYNEFIKEKEKFKKYIEKTKEIDKKT